MERVRSVCLGQSAGNGNPTVFVLCLAIVDIQLYPDQLAHDNVYSPRLCSITSIISLIPAPEGCTSKAIVATLRLVVATEGFNAVVLGSKGRGQVPSQSCSKYGTRGKQCRWAGPGTVTNAIVIGTQIRKRVRWETPLMRKADFPI
ncbi:BQ5605_C017g08480 [Microbotryum silenes-dioicae]|uniref:BQ5605_C017g08480 protein n=1 Tax=Microbotryum silenes-dioicae TaxID=796604 RepID=A0A2X0LV19_9BASI|nr:BQ5605_C017g08480 [Microbotryum silenes-dioicae]